MIGLFKDTPVSGKSNLLIQCPNHKLFDFIGRDLMVNYPKWSPEVKELSQINEGEIKQGTLCRQVRVDQGNRSESTFKVQVFEVNKQICFEGVSNPFRCDYKIEPVSPEESRITFIFELLKLEFHVRPFEKLVRIAVQEGTERTVRNIKKLVEEQYLRKP